jgi:hypothetical protein
MRRGHGSNVHLHSFESSESLIKQRYVTCILTLVKSALGNPQNLMKINFSLTPTGLLNNKILTFRKKERA